MPSGYSPIVLVAATVWEDLREAVSSGNSHGQWHAWPCRGLNRSLAFRRAPVMGHGSPRQLPSFYSEGLKITLVYMVAMTRRGYGPIIVG